jgi:uncharacterized damage-inducible protein DinB
MEMKQYLLDTFAFNDRANRQVLAKLAALPEKDECIRFFSHLVNSQDKWLARINAYPRDPGLDWWTPVYALEALDGEWTRSLRAWQEFLRGKTESALFAEVKWVGFDGAHWTAPLKDIALQLNYHSIHHRAQMQAILRAQGLEPEFVDYIGTVYRRLG